MLPHGSVGYLKVLLTNELKTEVWTIYFKSLIGSLLSLLIMTKISHCIVLSLRFFTLLLLLVTCLKNIILFASHYWRKISRNFMVQVPPPFKTSTLLLGDKFRQTTLGRPSGNLGESPNWKFSLWKTTRHTPQKWHRKFFVSVTP